MTLVDLHFLIFKMGLIVLASIGLLCGLNEVMQVPGMGNAQQMLLNSNE